MTDLQQRIASTEKEFRVWCEMNGFSVSPDGRVSETAAAQLLGLETSTLANLRSMGLSPAYFRRSWGGTRNSYRLRDLALHIENSRTVGVLE